MDGTPRGYKVNATDNVATVLEPVHAGQPVSVTGPDGVGTVRALEAIDTMHKIAIHHIAAQAAVIKFGVRIGHALKDIEPGSWVHLHNLASDYDDRSGSLDLETGAPTDTVYE